MGRSSRQNRRLRRGHKQQPKTTYLYKIDETRVDKLSIADLRTAAWDPRVTDEQFKKLIDQHYGRRADKEVLATTAKK